MHFDLTVDVDNAAFEDALASETARILRDVARRLERGEDLPFTLRDANGNSVGTCNFAE